MLDTLNKVDWQSLDAEEIPDKLLGLLSPDPEEREQHFWYLLDELADPDIAEGYGTLPEILNNELKAIVVGFLHEILTAQFSDSQVYALKMLRGFCYLFERDEGIEPYSMRLQQLRQRLEAGTDLYLKKLSHDDVRVRRAAVQLIQKFPVPNHNFVASLLEVIPLESDHRLQMLQIWTALYLANKYDDFLETYGADYIDLLMNLIGSTESNGVRVITSVVLAYLKREATPETAVEVIVQALITLEENGKYLAFESYEWLNDHYRLIEAIVSLNGERSKAALLKVIRNDTTPLTNVGYALDALLQLNFGTGEYSCRGIYEHEDPVQTFVGVYPQLVTMGEPVAEFNAAQRGLLHTLISIPRLQEFRTNLFEISGLPATIDGIKELLAGQP